MLNWFHCLFNPHCEHCALERREARICTTCEGFKFQLDLVHRENARLLSTIETLTTPPVVEPEPPVEDSESLQTGHKSFRLRRSILEAEDRAEAVKLRELKEMQDKAS